MAVQTASVLSPFIQSVYADLTQRGCFGNAHFLKLFAREDKAGVSYLVPTTATMNSGVQLQTNETSSLASATAAVHVTGTFSYKDVTCVFGWTGSAIRALGENGANGVYPEAGNIEYMDALRSARDLFETTFMADQTYGILGQVDDDTTAWGTLDRSTYTGLKSLVVAGGSATITEAVLSNLTSGISEDPYGGYPEVIISSELQRRLYLRNVVSAPTTNAAGVGDYGFSRNAIYADGIPWITVPNFVNTEVVALSGVSDGSGIRFVNHITSSTSVEIEPDPATSPCRVEIKELSRTADADTYVAILSGALVVLDPTRQGKIEALATS